MVPPHAAQGWAPQTHLCEHSRAEVALLDALVQAPYRTAGRFARLRSPTTLRTPAVHLCNSWMPHRLAALSPRHRTAIQLKLGGASGRQIAERVGVERRTIYLWMGDPMVKRELDSQLERLNDEVAVRLAAAALTGLEQLTDLSRQPASRDPDPMEKLAICKDILDRYERLRQERATAREWRVLSQLRRNLSAGDDESGP